jgi:hypothetical protein
VVIASFIGGSARTTGSWAKGAPGAILESHQPSAVSTQSSEERGEYSLDLSRLRVPLVLRVRSQEPEIAREQQVVLDLAGRAPRVVQEASEAVVKRSSDGNPAEPR